MEGSGGDDSGRVPRCSFRLQGASSLWKGWVGKEVGVCMVWTQDEPPQRALNKLPLERVDSTGRVAHASTIIR